jgi:hypothetical protein
MDSCLLVGTNREKEMRRDYAEGITRSWGQLINQFSIFQYIKELDSFLLLLSDGEYLPSLLPNVAGQGVAIVIVL